MRGNLWLAYSGTFVRSSEVGGCAVQKNLTEFSVRADSVCLGMAVVAFCLGTQAAAIRSTGLDMHRVTRCNA